MKYQPCNKITGLVFFVNVTLTDAGRGLKARLLHARGIPAIAACIRGPVYRPFIINIS